MKKLLIILALLIFAAPGYAKDIPYITYLPYKPYIKEIKLHKSDAQTFEQSKISLSKTKYDFEKMKKFGYAYEYFITNNTDNDLILQGAFTMDFYNRDYNGKRSKLWRNLFKTIYTTWQGYIPYYNLVYGAQMDLEKNPFIIAFPRNYPIKKGESIRILGSAPLGLDNPQAEFVFLINEQEQKIKF